MYVSSSSSSRHSFKENSEEISKINLDNNPLFQEVNHNVVVAVINFIYTGELQTISKL